MRLAEMLPVETTYEAVQGENVYRVTVATGHVVIKRTGIALGRAPMWHHGVITQGYDRGAQAFVPMVKASDLRLPPAEAEAVIASL